jgi:multidrug resistance efflux pump
MSTPRPNTPAAHNPRPRRRIFLISSVGVLALIPAVAIPALMPGWSRADKPAADAPAAAAAPSRSAGKASCFGYVDVEQGVAPLYPVQPGRVVEVMTKEGAAVEAGAPLFRVDDAMAKLRLHEAKDALAAAEARLTQARTLPEQHKSKVAALQAGIEAAREEVAAARKQYDKANRFFQKNIGGSEEDVGAAEALVRKAEAGVRAREAELAAANAVDPQIMVKLAEQDVDAKRVDVQKAELGLKECTVTAPAKGTVLRLTVSPGEVLGPSPHQAALIFCPDAPRIVRAEVEQEFADHITKGQTAAIQDDATAAGTWTGKVVRLSDWYTHRRSMLLEPLQYNDVRTLECIIELPPGQAPLRIGQRVRVMIGSVEP